MINKVYDYLAVPRTIDDIAKNFHITDREANSYIKDLISKNIVVVFGTAKKGKKGRSKYPKYVHKSYTLKLMQMVYENNDEPRLEDFNKMERILNYKIENGTI